MTLADSFQHRLREKLNAEASRIDPSYGQIVAPYEDWYESTLPYGWGKPAHIQKFNHYLDKVDRGLIDRIQFNAPPRHGKTETVTMRLPLRWLERYPTSRVLVTGFNDDFARKLSRGIRSAAYDRGMVSKTKSATNEWETTAGGLLMARGVGSPPVGTGFNLIVIDDPIRSKKDADSQAYRERVNEWYSTDIYQRLEPGGVIVIVMTRWHEDDLGSFSIDTEPDAWTVIKFKAIQDDGSALWPERFDLERLERTKGVMSKRYGLRSFNALYQQEPTAIEGAVFKVDQLNYIDAHEMPPIVSAVRGWDLGATDGDGDPTAGVKVGRDAEGNTYVQHVTTGRLEPSKRNRLMKATAAADGIRIRIRIPQDPGQAGKEQRMALVRMFNGYSVIALPVTGSKEVRAESFATQVNEGNVYIVRGPWNEPFVEELRTFPNGSHDDQVDAASDAFNLVSIPVPKKRRRPRSSQTDGLNY